MRPFVQSLMAKKVRDTLPENLSLCGYRNVVFYPMNKDFVSNGRFYAAIGMPEIYDMRAQKARPKERDRFYYANAMALMEEHFRTSERPLFTFISTMVAHQSYLHPFMPEVDVPGGGPGTPPQMHEYLRRLSMVRIDYDAFKADLARRFPNERFLILQYGDHQPVATRTLFRARQIAAVFRLKPSSPITRSRESITTRRHCLKSTRSMCPISAACCSRRRDFPCRTHIGNADD